MFAIMGSWKSAPRSESRSASVVNAVAASIGRPKTSARKRKTCVSRYDVVYIRI
jgi:hypothetical protein